MKQRGDHNVVRLKLLSNQLNNVYLREISSLTNQRELAKYRGDTFDRFVSIGFDCPHVDVKTVTIIPVQRVEEPIKIKEPTSAFYSSADRKYPFQEVAQELRVDCPRSPSHYERPGNPSVTVPDNTNILQLEDFPLKPPPSKDKGKPDFTKYSITPLVASRRGNISLVHERTFSKVGVRPMEEIRKQTIGIHLLPNRVPRLSHSPVTDGLRLYGLSADQVRWNVVKNGEMDVSPVWDVSLPMHHLPPMTQLARALNNPFQLENRKSKLSKLNLPTIH